MAEKLDIEAIKRAKDGLDVIHDIRRYAQEGFDTIQPEDKPLFRWYGLYQQRPNVGHFMQRVKVPGGRLNATQLREIGRIAIEHGRDLADITTRQTFQYHWLTIDTIPEIYERLQSVGLLTAGACGDITRNVVGCPLAGIAADEILDASALVDQVTREFSTNRDFSNLPRKYKVSISGCRIHCAQPQINCCSFFGAEQVIGGRKTAGFGLMIGGGLSTNPYLAADLGVFLHPEEVMEVFTAASEIYRDAPELRQSRTRARLKFLIHDPKFGIGGAGFRARLEEKLGRRLRDGGPFPFPKTAEVDHLETGRQTQEGLYYVGIGVTVGRLSGTQLVRIADLAEEFSTEQEIRNTRKQNFILTHVPEDKLPRLQQRLDALGLDYRPPVFKRSLVSCTGTEFCNLAVTETKELGRRVAEELDARFPGATRMVRVHFSGCPNNCGQNAIADIGLRGKKTKNAEGMMVEAFDILVGGGTGAGAAFSVVCTKNIPSPRIGWAIGNLYQGFLDWAATLDGGPAPGEPGDLNFRDYVDAHTLEQLDQVARGVVGEALAVTQVF